MAKYNKISKHKVHSENPFVDEMVGVPIKRKKVYAGSAGDVIVQSDTGEIKGHTAFMATKLYDTEQFVKVFTEGIKSIYDLNKAEHRLFYYILSITRANIDWVYVDVDDAKEFTGYKSTPAILSAVSGLVDKRIIAVSKRKHIYFINPQIFFNGNRVSFIKSAILKSDNSEKARLEAVRKIGNEIKISKDKE